MNQEVHIVQESNSDWWYGVSEDRCGYFPPGSVRAVRGPSKVSQPLVCQGRSQDCVRGFPSSWARSARENFSDHAHF